MNSTKKFSQDFSYTLPLEIPPKIDNKFIFLFYYLKKHWLSYSFGVLAILTTNWIAVSIPEYIQLSIDLLNDNLKSKQVVLFKYLIIMLELSAIMVIVRTLSRILFFNPGRSIEFMIKNDMFKKLMSLQRDYYEKNSSGSIISRINNDINGVRLICGFGLMQAFNITTALSMTPFKMWQISPQLMLFCFIPIVLVFTAIRLGMHVLVKNMRLRMESLQNLSGFTISSLSAIDLIKSETMGTWCKKRFEEKNKEMLLRSMKIAWIRSFVMPMLNNLEYFLKLLVLILGGMMVIKNFLTIGELTAFIAYIALLTGPLTSLGWVTTMFQQGLVGLTSIQTILNQDLPRTKLLPFAKKKQETLFTEKGLTVKNLNFRYPGGKENVLRNINFKILPGQIFGILGKIGSGKSTLVNSLNRYLEISSNTIFLGNQDITKMRDKDVRSSIKTVTQEPFLFSDTVEKNIIFGIDKNYSISKEKLWDILRSTALESDVLRFPKREETLVGEKGIMLSGGQKQRISLARAMIKPCDLLILDNVLSSIDYETERYLLNEIFNLLKPKKTKQNTKSMIIISHRVTSMEKADWILILDKGQIIDQGQHKDLILRPGYYQQMWELQNNQSK